MRIGSIGGEVSSMLSREDRECDGDMVDTAMTCFIDEDSRQDRLLGKSSDMEFGFYSPKNLDLSRQGRG